VNDHVTGLQWPLQVEAFHRTDPAEGNICLACSKGSWAEVDHCLVVGVTLRLVHSDSPGEPERKLLELGDDFLFKLLSLGVVAVAVAFPCCWFDLELFVVDLHPDRA